MMAYDRVFRISFNFSFCNNWVIKFEANCFLRIMCSVFHY